MVKPLVGSLRLTDRRGRGGYPAPSRFDGRRGGRTRHLSRYSDIDAYWMTACMVLTKRCETPSPWVWIRIIWRDSTTSAGAIRCSRKKHRMATSSSLACARQRRHFDITTVCGVPFRQGQRENDYSIGRTKSPVPPSTLLYSVIGKIPDIRQAVTMDAKRPQNLVYILGETRNELGGSGVVAKQGAINGKVPQVEAKRQ